MLSKTSIGSLKHGILVVLICIVCVVPFASGQLCYAPDGKVLRNYGICNREDNASLCCAPGDQCWSNSLCVSNGTFYRGGCLSKSYLQATCPNFCDTGKFNPGCRPDSELTLSQGVSYWPPTVAFGTEGKAVEIQQVGLPLSLIPPQASDSTALCLNEDMEKVDSKLAKPDPLC